MNIIDTTVSKILWDLNGAEPGTPLSLSSEDYTDTAAAFMAVFVKYRLATTLVPAVSFKDPDFLAEVQQEVQQSFRCQKAQQAVLDLLNVPTLSTDEFAHFLACEALAYAPSGTQFTPENIAYYVSLACQVLFSGMTTEN